MTEHRPASPSANVPRHGAFYEPARESALPALGAARGALQSLPYPPVRISRVAQLDAELLDNELEGLLSEPVVKSLQALRVRDWSEISISLSTQD
jgi:peroxin-2